MDFTSQKKPVSWFCGLIAATLLASTARSADLPDPAPLHYLNIQTINPQVREQFIAAMRNNATQSREESANIVFDVADLGGSDPTLVLFESWRDRAGYLAHEDSAHVAPVIALVPTGFAKPERKYLLQNIGDLPAPSRKAITHPNETKNIIARLSIRPAQRQAFIDAVRPVMAQSRLAQGNLEFDVYQQYGEANEFVIYQRWADAKAYQHYLDTPYAATFSTQLQSLSDGTPEVLQLRDRILD